MRSLEILKDGGTLVSIVGLTEQARNTDRDVTAVSILVEANGEQLDQIGQLIDSSNLEPIVNYRFSLDEAPQGHEQSETRRSRGKIVYIIRD